MYPVFLQPNQERAKWAMALIVAGLVMSIIALISDFVQLDLLQRIAKGDIFMVEAESNDTRQMWIGLLVILIYIISVFTFIMWFRRAYWNLHQKVHNLSHSEGWAAGAWFVPIVNLFRPYQIMNELYEKTEIYLINKGIKPNTSLNTTHVGIWWTFWIICGIIGRIVFRLSLNAEEPAELILATQFSIVGEILDIPLCLLAFFVIKRYADNEALLWIEDEPEPESVIPITEGIKETSIDDLLPPA
jgi:uncharacterized membrane protein